MNIKSELQSNNVDLQTVLDKVKSLPDAGSGGSGGGGAVETCTLVLVNDWVNEFCFAVTRFVDGEITDNNWDNTVWDGDSMTIENVLCNSSVGIVQPPFTGDFAYSLSGADTIEHGVYKITAPSGGVATITIREPM